jgi:hypothetical protein
VAILDHVLEEHPTHKILNRARAEIAFTNGDFQAASEYYRLAEDDEESRGSFDHWLTDHLLKSPKAMAFFRHPFRVEVLPELMVVEALRHQTNGLLSAASVILEEVRVLEPSIDESFWLGLLPR